MTAPRSQQAVPHAGRTPLGKIMQPDVTSSDLISLVCSKYLKKNLEVASHHKDSSF